jgi:hypothetical protein
LGCLERQHSSYREAANQGDTAVKTLPLFATLFVTASASAAQVWVAPASQKIRPALQAPANAPTTAKIAAAQNEFESFHVVVTGAASGVSVGLEGLNDGRGHTITGRDAILYREALINVASPTGGDGAAGLWPDALIPAIDPIVGEKRNAFPDAQVGLRPLVERPLRRPRRAGLPEHAG